MGRSSSREDNWIQTGLIGNNDDIRVGSSRESLGSDDDDYDEDEQQKDDSEDSSMMIYDTLCIRIPGAERANRWTVKQR